MSGDADPPAAAQHRSTASAAPRKRRKRTTAAGGAADDCFTCAASGLKCDRRRPYCSQCLDQGRDCAGYKTTLTWGVGVASRGKLRGLSLPVSDGTASQPKSALKARKQLDHPPARRKRSATGSPSIVTPSETETDPFAVTSSPVETYHQPVHWPPRVSQPPLALDTFQQVNDHGVVYHGPAAIQFPADVFPAAELSPQHTSPDVPSSAWAVPLTATSTSSYPGSSSIPYAPEYHQPDYQTGFYTLPPAVASHRCSSSQIKHENELEEEHLLSLVYEDHHPHHRYPVASYRQTQTSWHFTQSPFANSLPDMLLEQSVGRTPRMRYLISYFAEVIAPVIVAFDRPSNPYRTRILRLAHHSETLQHAIAALSASNIRQRREEKILSTERTEQARKSSMAHRALTDASFQERHGIKDLGTENREEVYHKSVAIRSLNSLLADPSKRHSDSVLASLLVLCLFHVCETGVAQFQTQFAGVRKLLAMRHRNNMAESEEAKWCTRMFTWFDAMTATINNREGQLQGLYLDKTCLSDEEWALENLAGCDGRLFKIMARLGRLNVLSQNRPVDPSYNIDMPVSMPIVPPSLSHYHAVPSGIHTAYAPSSYESPQTAHSGDTTEFWTEWHSIRQQLESWRLDPTTLLASGYDVNNLPFQSSPNSNDSLSSSGTSGSTMGSSPTAPTLTVSSNNLADLSNISEAFRYSALLYTERVAHPDIPSTHTRIQTFVITAMHYIAAVESDVYLLWPLFITGSECVYEEHRAAIRNRCKDIQKDSGFYNNISCLELLEKIWARNPAVSSQNRYSMPYHPHPHPHPQHHYQDLYMNHGYSGSPVSNMRAQTRDVSLSSAQGFVSGPSPPDAHGFRWQSIIEAEGVDGEYIVV
ncbi:hypothetical protein UA08_07200 [Talaromyces atroroseus]|uniref:Zn(2)-C6 fungal-type domain-containing protein n=1 Tax=Talaromyces atroroseus TaxID=1441469 RepID=A0A225ARA6_TALAT|nr:hypothetical protein UA08_07200 [Talaromyces atroroseus]OKL57476.1 hypothetical protein UA08_07200 [Talaromyces atroroseus]